MRRAHTQVKVAVLGDVAMGAALGKVRFEPWYHSIELWCRYHLVLLQFFCPTFPQLSCDVLSHLLPVLPFLGQSCELFG